MQRDKLQRFKIEYDDLLFDEFQKEYGGLIMHYATRMYQKTKKYGEELEDCIQQCWICFFKAIKNYDMSSEYNFTAFLVSCLTNQMLNYLRDFYRRRENVTTFSYNNLIKDEENITYLELFESDDKTPSYIYEINEAIDDFKSRKNITELEKEIFIYYLKGFSYEEISKKLGIPRKKVDNLIRKVKNILAVKK